jgi:hypothetical protein
MTSRSHPNIRRRWALLLRRRDVLLLRLEKQLAPISGPALRITHTLLLVITIALIVCLALLATHRDSPWPPWVPKQLQWLNNGANWEPVAIVTTVIGLLCFLTFRLQRNRTSARAPVMIVAGLTVTSLVLGLFSLWGCADNNHPKYITPLLWTISLVKGSTGDFSLKFGMCPAQTPTALVVGRLTIIAAFFIGLAGVVTAAFRAQADRMRAARARSVTVVVDLDDDSASMIGGIVRTLRPSGALVLMTENPDKACIAESRRQGARVIQVDFDRPETLVAHRFWRRLKRLYLLSADPSSNLFRLSIISQRLALTGKLRIPLIVRIDDPWLAETWRTQQFGQHGGSADHLWAADTVSKYEATARRLIDQILGHKTIRQLIICGTSQLTLALCAEVAQRHTERSFHELADQAELPQLTLIAPNAGEYSGDHKARYKRKGFSSEPPPVEPVEAVPSGAEVSKQIRAAEGEEASKAVIVVDSAAIANPILGTWLAASHPTVPIYMWDPAARINAERIPVAGELRTYRLGMELPDGHAHDNFERTAMLIHERFSKDGDRTRAAALPWERLNDFYKGSNRRQLEHALWMVEKLAGHTWRSGDTPGERITPEGLDKLDAVGRGGGKLPDVPLDAAVEKLRRLGLSKDVAYVLAQQEWEAWSTYLRARDWTFGDTRNVENKTHERLVESWEAGSADTEFLTIALVSLFDAREALAKLKGLGISEDDAYRMAEKVWEAWSKYLHDQGWTLGAERSIAGKRHERLVDSWDAAWIDPTLKALALKSLADTQIALEILRRLGFSEDTALAMAKAEFESWSRYLRENGWTLGDKRDELNKKNEKLVDSWQDTVIDPVLKAAALRSLATTLVQLLKLGYRSRPMWHTYRRVGSVTAKRRRTRWVWTTASGNPAHASAGDWEVFDGDHSHPVHNHAFRATHERQQGRLWDRKGTVLARPARAGETIHTLEGPVTAADGDWVIQGNRGEQWPVPDDEFRRRYDGPVSVYESEEALTGEPEAMGDDVESQEDDRLPGFVGSRNIE